MRGKIVNAEDFVTNRPRRMIVLTCDMPGEAKIVEIVRNSTDRSLKIVFGENENELRVLLPDSCLPVEVQRTGAKRGRPPKGSL